MSHQSRPSGVIRRCGALLVCCALASGLWLFATAEAATPVTLQVVAPHGLLGLHHSALSRLIAAQMTRVGLADWRFESTTDALVAADRVEWSFKLNPYAGGAVRSFVRLPTDQPRSGGRRPVTIEARLYLEGQYQTLVEEQATVRGDPDDPDLAAAVASATRLLLGPQGAYRAIDRGLHSADQ
jgi:hypothetical protein